jgi:hypothetical protein
MAGIEPATSAWKAEVLPLNYIRIFLNLHLNLHLLYAVTNYSSDRTIVKKFLLSLARIKTRNIPDPFQCDLAPLSRVDHLTSATCFSHQSVHSNRHHRGH